MHMATIEYRSVMHMATIEYRSVMHAHKRKVRTKEKREVRGPVDNNRISLKNQQIARIGLGKKCLYSALFLMLLRGLALVSRGQDEQQSFVR